MGILAGLKFKATSKKFNPDEFANLIEQAYDDMGFKTTTKAKVSFSPSQIGFASGACPRRWFYAFTGGIEQDDDRSPMSTANMMNGIDAGKRIADVLDAAGVLVEAEREAKYDDPPIRGYIDAIIRWNDLDVVVEVKTTRQESFVKRSLEMKAPGYQLLQLLIYMRIAEIDRGLFIVENKNNHELLFIPVKWTDENIVLIDHAFDWMREVYANWQSGELPKRPFTENSKECKSCPFRSHCWAGKEGSKELFPLQIPQ